jgi:signal transduction histidine kinase
VKTLADFVEARREAIARRWLDRVRAQLRSEQALDEDEVLDSLLLFLDEVVQALRRQTPLGESGEGIAQGHGAQRQILQRDIDDVVREYGLLFEAVVEECLHAKSGPFAPEEYGRLVGLLSRGAAEATRQFAELHALELRRQAWEHFAFIAHEIRSPLQTARMASKLIRSGAGPGRAAEVLERSLAHLSEAIDHALVDARLRGIDAGAALRRESTELRKILAKAVEESQPDAEGRQISIGLEAGGPIPIEADERVLRSALGNLLRNAVKFTRSGGKVTLRAQPGIVEIEDECGGLRSGDEGKIFEAFRQSGEDRSGFGLGLAIARQGIEAHGGALQVRNLPGKGCVFVATLPGTG